LVTVVTSSAVVVTAASVTTLTWSLLVAVHTLVLLEACVVGTWVVVPRRCLLYLPGLLLIVAWVWLLLASGSLVGGGGASGQVVAAPVVWGVVAAVGGVIPRPFPATAG